MEAVTYETTPKNTKNALRLFRFCGWRIKVVAQNYGTYTAEMLSYSDKWYIIEKDAHGIPFQTAEAAQFAAICSVARGEHLI